MSDLNLSPCQAETTKIPINYINYTLWHTDCSNEYHTIKIYLKEPDKDGRKDFKYINQDCDSDVCCCSSSDHDNSIILKDLKLTMDDTRKRSVLVIDDDSLNRKLLRTILQLEGKYIVHETSDAVEGFRKANEYRPDVILMDIRMPGIDGFLATQIIKQESNLKDIPIIAVSSEALEDDREKAIEVGCSGYITKPINVRSFIDTMEQFIS